jgi:hypothetical protein
MNVLVRGEMELLLEDQWGYRLMGQWELLGRDQMIEMVIEGMDD